LALPRRFAARTYRRYVVRAAVFVPLLLVAVGVGIAGAATVERFTLVIGANEAGPDRPQLRYAVTDAERFARVLVELGGVSRENEIVLRQPKLRELVAALDLLQARVVRSIDARRGSPEGAGRTEVFVYYSGHADEQGLLLGDDRYSYRSLRARLDQIPADVRIAVLDACASGAFTRIKSGKTRPAFLVDQSADMRGHAFLTSSAANEAAQESDRIRASYFTHYLVSGFRGAADLSGDGKVTLGEAYQFASNETLGRTVDTRAGPQHPSYDINLSGTGDLVMTDVRQTSATLVLPAELDGRFFVRTAARELIVELYKPRGREVRLGVEPGAYEVRLEAQKTALMAKAQLAEGAAVVLDPQQFGVAAVEAARRRGDADGLPYSVAGRNRLELRTGMWRIPDSGIATVRSGADTGGLFGGAQYTRYLRERLAVTLAVQTVGAESGASVGPLGMFAGTAGVLNVPIGVRWNPFRGSMTQATKPYIAVALGPVFGASDGSFMGNGLTFAGARTQVTSALASTSMSPTRSRSGSTAATTGWSISRSRSARATTTAAPSSASRSDGCSVKERGDRS
jgi:uncharacterized caspase-like protein